MIRDRDISDEQKIYTVPFIRLKMPKTGTAKAYGAEAKLGYEI